MHPWWGWCHTMEKKKKLQTEAFKEVKGLFEIESIMVAKDRKPSVQL